MKARATLMWELFKLNGICLLGFPNRCAFHGVDCQYGITTHVIGYKDTRTNHMHVTATVQTTW